MNAAVRLPDHIDTLLLDLDGTLLDLAFDTSIWLEEVPQRYGQRLGVSAQEAHERHIHPRLRDAEGTLKWYCLDFWSQALDMDLRALHLEYRERIAWLPGAQDFLRRQRAAGRRIVLATNSHTDLLRIKDEQAGIAPFFDAMYSSHEFGAPKEYAEFWLRLNAREPYDPARTAFVDDNLKVLAAARAAGIDTVIAVTNPDSSRPPRTPPAGYQHVAAVAQIS